MTYNVKPSDVYPNKEEVDRMLGCEYKITGFRIPEPGDKYIGTWWGTTYDENRPSYSTYIKLRISVCRRGDFFGGPCLIIEDRCPSSTIWE